MWIRKGRACIVLVKIPDVVSSLIRDIVTSIQRLFDLNNLALSLNNASNYLQYSPFSLALNIWIMQVITSIICITRIILIFECLPVCDSHYFKYMSIWLKPASHYSHRLDSTCIDLCEAMLCIIPNQGYCYDALPVVYPQQSGSPP